MPPQLTSFIYRSKNQAEQIYIVVLVKGTGTHNESFGLGCPIA